jgi:WD40 repeat protein
MLQAASPEEVAEPSTAPVLAAAPLPPAPTPRLRPKPAEPRAWASAPSPDGAITAVARDNEVVLRRRDGKTTALGPGKPLALAFAPNNQLLATAGPGPLVRTWDYGGNLLAEAYVPAAARSIAYTPDGGRLLILDAAGGISVREPGSLAPVSEWSVEGPANSIACSPDSQIVAVAFGSWLGAETGWVECWSIAGRRKLASYSASAPVGAARFGPEGRRLILGGWNGLLTWRGLPGGELIAERQLAKSLVAAAAFSPDAGTLPFDPPPLPPPPAPIPQLGPMSSQQISQLPQR